VCVCVCTEADQCKQTCVSSVTREVVTIDVEVSDGTPCDYDHPTNICYLGKCLVNKSYNNIILFI
jgi:hypothetical protein